MRYASCISVSGSELSAGQNVRRTVYLPLFWQNQKHKVKQPPEMLAIMGDGEQQLSTTKK